MKLCYWCPRQCRPNMHQKTRATSEPWANNTWVKWALQGQIEVQVSRVNKIIRSHINVRATWVHTKENKHHWHCFVNAIMSYRLWLLNITKIMASLHAMHGRSSTGYPRFWRNIDIAIMDEAVFSHLPSIAKLIMQSSKYSAILALLRNRRLSSLRNHHRIIKALQAARA